MDPVKVIPKRAFIFKDCQEVRSLPQKVGKAAVSKVTVSFKTKLRVHLETDMSRQAHTFNCGWWDYKWLGNIFALLFYCSSRLLKTQSLKQIKQVGFVLILCVLVLAGTDARWCSPMPMCTHTAPGLPPFLFIVPCVQSFLYCVHLECHCGAGSNVGVCEELSGTMWVRSPATPGRLIWRVPRRPIQGPLRVRWVVPPRSVYHRRHPEGAGMPDAFTWWLQLQELLAGLRVGQVTSWS